MSMTYANCHLGFGSPSKLESPCMLEDGFTATVTEGKGGRDLLPYSPKPRKLPTEKSAMGFLGL